MIGPYLLVSSKDLFLYRYWTVVVALGNYCYLGRSLQQRLRNWRYIACSCEWPCDHFQSELYLFQAPLGPPLVFVVGSSGNRFGEKMLNAIIVTSNHFNIE